MKLIETRFGIVNMLVTGILVILLMLLGLGYYALSSTNKEIRKSAKINALAEVKFVSKRVVESLASQTSIWKSYSKQPHLIDALTKSNQKFDALENPIKQVERIELIQKTEDNKGASLSPSYPVNSTLSDQLNLQLMELEKLYGVKLFTNVELYNKFGVLVAQTSLKSKLVQAEKTWWGKTKSRGQLFSISPTTTSRKQQTYLYSFAILNKSSQFIGVFRVSLNLTEIENILKSSSEILSKTAATDISLLSNKNQFLFDTNFLLDTKKNTSNKLKHFNLLLSPENESGLFDEKTERIIFNLNESYDPPVEELQILSPIDLSEFGAEESWSLVVSKNANQILNANRVLGRGLSLAGALVIIISAVLASFMIFNLKKRLQKLTTATLGLASGNLDIRIGEQGRDEISQVAQAFDKMASSLQTLNSELDERLEEVDTANFRRGITLAAARVVEWEYEPKSRSFSLAKHWRSELGIQSTNTTSQGFLTEIHTDDRRKLLLVLANFLQRTDELIEVPARVKTSSEEERWVLIRGQLIDYENEIIGGVILDITEQKKLELKLSQTNRLESMGQLSAGIAHEINTPMQYIRHNLEFMNKASSRMADYQQNCEELIVSLPTGREKDQIMDNLKKCKEELKIEKLQNRFPIALDDALQGVTAVSTIIKAMKDFSHRDKEEKVETDLNKVIKTSIDVSRHEWKNVAEIRRDLNEEIPLVPAYQGELNQVMLNIIVNAAHALSDYMKETDDHVGLIIVETRENLEENCVEVEISDNGPGIPEEIREKVFDQFFTTKEVGRGTGQGLAICHQIVVNRHGGDLTVNSEEGKGTSFTIKLPK